MPIALIFIGLILIVTAVKGTFQPLLADVKEDFTGPGNFFYWLFAIIILGAIGYYAPAKGTSRLFLLLIFVSYVLSNRGVFMQAQKALASTASIKPASTPAASSDGAALSLPLKTDTLNKTAMTNLSKTFDVAKKALLFFGV